MCGSEFDFGGCSAVGNEEFSQTFSYTRVCAFFWEKCYRSYSLQE
jgi:hypothetical protein